MAGKGIWRHDFDERMAGRVDAVMKLLVKHRLVVVSTFSYPESSFTRLHLSYDIRIAANLSNAIQLDSICVSHSYASCIVSCFHFNSRRFLRSDNVPIVCQFACDDLLIVSRSTRKTNGWVEMELRRLSKTFYCRLCFAS